METCLLTINSSSSIQKSQEERTWWRHLCIFHFFLSSFPSFPFCPSVFWISQKLWSDLVEMLLLWLCREFFAIMEEQIVLCPTKMGSKELHGCFQAREARQEAAPFHEALSQQGKKTCKTTDCTLAAGLINLFLFRPTLSLSELYKSSKKDCWEEKVCRISLDLNQVHRELLLFFAPSFLLQ